MTFSRTRGFALLLLSASACSAPDAGRPDPLTTTFLAIASAEDSRPTEGRQLETLLRASRLDHVFLRQSALRALGRLQNPELADEIALHLADERIEVRAEAADALAQAVHRNDGAVVYDMLMTRIQVESEPAVLGVVARSLARLQVDEVSRSRALATLLDLTLTRSQDAPIAQLGGVTLGIESLIRAGTPLTERARGRLNNLLSYDRTEGRNEPESSRVRALAVAALGRAGAMTGDEVEPALRDPAVRVRIAASAYIGNAAPQAQPELIRRALDDPSVGVRINAVRLVLQGDRSDAACRSLLAVATRDAARGPRILAVDGLAEACGDAGVQTQTLFGLASALSPGTADDWQVPAHAFVSLAQLSPGDARALLPTFANHPNPFVRGYGARGADALDEVAVVTSMAGDPSANVRTIAMQLLDARGLVSDEMLIAQLSDDDPQLLMTASRLLAGSDMGMVVASATLTAFERISRARRETWRDSRSALLARVAELGNRSLIERLEPFLNDYDPIIAGEVARTMRSWTGEPYTPEAQPLPLQALPNESGLATLESSLVVLHMRRGGEIHVQPLPYLALTNAARFVRLARDGYFDGLTFHRWAANFVIQGGSPGANEYAGDGPFSRDEVGQLPHWRGTMGVSTRGHDTADGQMFINLTDNVRLDHDYTVYGLVVAGMEFVDDVVEGDVIERAEVRTAS
jgi:cyclophilin family peptidyl-prolyl cis-trans isomerase/HEAT repeat protein